MVTVDVTIVNVALPALGHSLQANIGNLQWVVDGYTLSFACLLLSAGHMSDRIGARRCFQGGVCGFALTSAACALATSIPTLCAARILQGICAALVVPSSVALIHQAYPDKVSRSHAIGIWGGVGGIAAATGPVLGGVLVHFGTWHWVFWVNVPVAAFAFILSLLSIAPVRPKLAGKLDLPAQCLAVAALGILAASLISAGQLGWSNLCVLIGVGAFVILTVCFLFRETRTDYPMLPLDLFSSSEFSGAVFIGFVINMGFYGQLFLLPLFFHNNRGYSTLLTALAILPQPGLASLASYLAGKYVNRIGAARVMIIGLTIGACGFLCFSYGVEILASYIGLLVPLMAVGFGTAFTMPAATIAVMESVSETRSGIAAGCLNAFRQIGSLVGVAIFGMLIGRLPNIVSAMQVAAILSASLFGGGAILALLTKPKKRTNFQSST